MNIKGNCLDSNKLFLAVDDVTAILGISKSTAYREIKRLNDELKRKGYITVNTYSHLYPNKQNEIAEILAEYVL